MIKINLQYFGGRGSAGGTNMGKSSKSEPTKKPVKTASSSQRSKKSVDLEMERGMPQMAVSGVKEEGYKLMGKLDMSKSNIQNGDSFGIRILGMRNHDVYGRITKVTDSSITVTVNGSEYKIPTKKVEVNGRELRFRPKDDKAGWFGFVDLRKYYTKDDFKKK